MRIILAGGDCGTLIDGAVRIARGQVFARDFFEVMGPGTFYWLAAYFKLFGISILATKICLFVTSLGTGLAMYFLSRQVCTRYRILPALILAGTYFNASWPEISHHVDSNFFGLLAIVCAVIWRRSGNKYLLCLAGVLACVTASILQPKGLYLFLALLAWLWTQRRRLSAPLISAGILALGYFGAAVCILMYFWHEGALRSLFYANVVFPARHYGQANGVPYAFDLIGFFWHPWVTGNMPKWVAGLGAIILAPIVFVAALPALLAIIAIRTEWKLIMPELSLYWLCGWALWLSEFHRKDIFHLIQGSALLILLCICALTESQKRSARIILQIVTICTVFLLVFNCGFVLVAGTRASLTRVGTIAVIGKEDALQLLDKYAQPGEEVFVYPYCPSLYFLSATTNPTRYSFLVYGYNTPQQFRETVQTLDEKHVKYVLWDTTFGPIAARVFPGLPPVETKDLILEPYLESHYAVIQNDHGFLLMERKD